MQSDCGAISSVLTSYNVNVKGKNACVCAWCVFRWCATQPNQCTMEGELPPTCVSFFLPVPHFPFCLALPVSKSVSRSSPLSRRGRKRGREEGQLHFQHNALANEQRRLTNRSCLFLLAGGECLIPGLNF